jgi:hypothetical protein
MNMICKRFYKAYIILMKSLLHNKLLNCQALIKVIMIETCARVCNYKKYDVSILRWYWIYAIAINLKEINNNKKKKTNLIFATYSLSVYKDKAC